MATVLRVNAAHYCGQGRTQECTSRESSSQKLPSMLRRSFTASSSCEATSSLGYLRLLNRRSRLLFMTYNGWIMLAVGFGAFVGYLGFANSTSVKNAACH